MIARIWTGVVRREDGDAYADYIRETGFSDYAGTVGNRGGWMLRRDQAERTEFITFSLWDSVRAIRAFAGEDLTAQKARILLMLMLLTTSDVGAIQQAFQSY